MLLTIQKAGVKTAFDMDDGPCTSFVISVAPAKMKDFETLEINSKEGLGLSIRFQSLLVDSEKLALGLEKMAGMIREKYLYNEVRDEKRD